MIRHQLLTIATASLLAASALGAQKLVPVRVADLVPPHHPASGAFSQDGRHTYYFADKQLWHFDRRTHVETAIAAVVGWDLTISANGRALAMTRDGEDGKGQFIWTIPLDPTTGLAAGAPRRVSMIAGDTPAISPDATQLAFARDNADGQSQSVLVLPLGGGPERVLFSAKGTGMGRIDWSPDSKTIYFGVNPLRASRRTPGTIYRVPATGGQARVLVPSAGLVWPLLSPSGRYIAYGDTGVSGRIIVVDTSGRRVGSFLPPAAMLGTIWMPGDKLAFGTGMDRPAIATYSLANRTTRVLVDSLGFIGQPAWSPDGKRIAFVHGVGFRREIVIMNADGSHWRRYPTNEMVNGLPYWSPDGRFISYHGFNVAHSNINVLDLASGRDHAIVAISSFDPISWAPDSRHLYVTLSETPNVDPAVGPPPASRHIRVAEVALDGKSRILADTTLSGYSNLHVVGSSTLFIRGDLTRATAARPLAEDGRTVQLVAANSGFVAMPIFSRDGKWVAIRRNTSGNNNLDMRALDVMRIDGSERQSVTTPFAMLGGETLEFLPGNKALLVADSTAVYRISLPGGTVAKLFDRPVLYDLAPFALSPDGRTLLFKQLIRVSPTLSTIDVTSLRNP